ncbi:DUF4231 domain-containing protein [Lysinibacillus endophyticus]|uniref:DUF4231 domain-containing protein n=2 Tax=Ureibacillus endophyticus TaxID=1978490 RepID=A0A494Z107_9BACL|nr:DUF4231 domain-containing protein [Lysinibacillus endophyticus]
MIISLGAKIMSSMNKLDVLITCINENIAYFEKRKVINRKRAYLLNLASIISSALITLLLGLKAVNVNLFTNIALFFASFLTIVNGIESFFNHKGLWYKDARTLANLKELKRDIDFKIAGEPIDNISMKILNEYKNRLQNILSEDINTWSKMREELDQTQHVEKN